MPGTPLERRLQFVTGKGGVGKTTVAAALALLLARRGRRTLAVEMDAAGRLPALLGGTASATPREVRPGLHVLAVDGRTALEEYLGMIIPVKRLLASVFSSRVYQYFVAAAPGLKELMTVGKIWFEATREEAGRPAWDAVIVDAPATGHGLQYLRMPQAAMEAFGAGLVQREAKRIVDLLRDARTTAVHLVTLAEDMPVTEALEARTELTQKLGLPLGHVVVNRFHDRHFAAGALARLGTAVAQASGAEHALLESVAARAAEEQGWSDINAEHLGRLEAAVGAVVTLPFVFAEEFDAGCVARLSELLEHAVGGGRAVTARRAR